MEATEVASVKAAVEDTAEVRVKVVAEDTALLNVHRPPAPRLSSCSRSFLRWNWRIRRKTRIISGRSWWGTKWGYGGSSGAAPVHVHVHSAPAPTHPHPIQSSPYGGGHGGGNQSGGYGGSAGGHAPAPISQSYQQPSPVPNRFLLMEGNKEDRQEDTLLPLPTSQLQLLLMVLLLSLLKVIRTSHFSSRKIN